MRDALVRFRTNNLRPAPEPNVWAVVFALGPLPRLLAAAGNRGKRRCQRPLVAAPFNISLRGDPQGGCARGRRGRCARGGASPCLATMVATLVREKLPAKIYTS